MLITYFRSSSYNAWALCQMQYFLVYCLGLANPGGKKAEKGTIVHKVMECLAATKKCFQDGTKGFEDDALGYIEVPKNLFDERFVQILTEVSYNYYVSRSKHSYTRGDNVNCHDWVHKVLDEKTFDPRHLDIVSPEKHFDFVIDKPWATYDYTLPCGRKLQGQLAMKGTIDLITRQRDDFYEIVDWKTGQRKDWATGAEKDFWKLSCDPQLRMYQYALKRLYPHLKYVALTIHWINDGGPYTLSFGPEDMEETEKLIEQRLKHIQRTTRPALKGRGKHWFCNRVCHFGKTLWPGDVRGRTICQYINDELVKHGMDYVIDKYTAEGFNIGYYQNPGS